MSPSVKPNDDEANDVLFADLGLDAASDAWVGGSWCAPLGEVNFPLLGGTGEGESSPKVLRLALTWSFMF